MAQNRTVYVLVELPVTLVTVVRWELAVGYVGIISESNCRRELRCDGDVKQ